MSTVGWYVSFVEPWWAERDHRPRFVYRRDPFGTVKTIEEKMRVLGCPQLSVRAMPIPWTKHGLAGFCLHIAYVTVLGGVLASASGSIRRRGNAVAVDCLVLSCPLALSYCLAAASAMSGCFVAPWLGVGGALVASLCLIGARTALETSRTDCEAEISDAGQPTRGLPKKLGHPRRLVCCAVLAVATAAWYVSLMEPWWVRRWQGSAPSPWGRPFGKDVVHMVSHPWLAALGLDPSDLSQTVPWTRQSLVGFGFHLTLGVIIGSMLHAVRDNKSPTRLKWWEGAAPLVLLGVSYALSCSVTAPEGRLLLPWVGSAAGMLSALAALIAWHIGSVRPMSNST